MTEAEAYKMAAWCLEPVYGVCPPHKSQQVADKIVSALMGRVKKRKNAPRVRICYAEDMHPYNCVSQTCIHCKRRKTKDHNPKTCALCNWEKEKL